MFCNKIKKNALISKFQIIIIVVLFFTIHLFGQKQELDKVTKSELEEKFYSSDPTAEAVILFKKSKTIFNYSPENGFSVETEVAIKIKIYSKNGLDWANFEIPYYVGYKILKKEGVTILKAFTYNLENGEIDKQKVNSESKFKESVNEFWETKTITFPNVKVGSIIELKYKLKSENLSELPVFQYQYQIPVDFASYITEIPAFYVYKTIKTGYVEVTVKDKIGMATRNFYDSKKFGNKTNDINYKEVKTTYQAVKIPALHEEAYVSNINDYYAKIENELQTIQYPDEPIKQIATTWENVAKSIYDSVDFGVELKKRHYFLNDLRRILQKAESKEEDLKIIYEFVRNKMNWNHKFGYYTQKGNEKAFEEATGNSAEINLVLTAMLRENGLDANPVLLSTKENGVAHFPNRSKFNYVIASVLLNGKRYLLDATNKYGTVNNLPDRVLNDVGRMIKEDGTSETVDLVPKLASINVVKALVTLDKDGVFSGQIREQHLDNNALRWRENFSGLSNNNIAENKENDNKGLEISDFELTEVNNLEEPLGEKYAIKTSNSAEIIGDKMYFSPMMYFATKENPFKQDKREYPVDFAYPFIDKYMFNITIPDSYQIESLPKPMALAMANDYGIFNYTVTNTGNRIQLLVTLDLKTSIIPAEDYLTLKEFFKTAIEKQNEKIVLKKI
jgi:hypothetical protein